MAVWFSGNALVSINVVTLRWSRLVPGLVTGWVNYLGMQSATQVNSAWPPSVGRRLGAMSTNVGWEGNRRSGVALAMRHRQ